MRGRFTSGKSQGFLLLLVGLLVSIFIGTFASPTTVGAQATWDNSRLEYNGQTYSPINDQTMLQNLGLEDETRVYGVLVESSTPPEFRVISFPTNADMQTAASARHIVFEYTPPSTYDQVSSQIITTEPAGENSGGLLNGGLESGTSCTISGIGWFVCPVSNFLANGMDWLYGVLTQFLTSQPLNVSDRTSGLYIAWNIMRGIANAVFIISFIIIIYSHISNMGVSNYGIKKMLPRLVVAAVLVNISYYICAIAIDLSNIIGQSIQDMFISIRNTITTVGNASEAMPTWEQVTTYVLSAGTAGAAAGVFFFTHSGKVGSAAIMLLPILLGLLITAMVVLLVLAARQALIVILTIISPLAFVAYLLPGTEKWFDKWKDLFLTMLIFFPAFSAVFGGSQLAGAAIIQNANSVVMLILGLGVQIAPLAIAPLILKLSGGLLNRFAGVVNNPAKGLIDRTRNIAKEQSQHLANKARSKENLKWWNMSRKIGQRANQYQTNRKKRIEDYQNRADLAAKDNKKYKKYDIQSRHTDRRAERLKEQLEADYGIARAGQLTPEMQAMQRKWPRGMRQDREMTKIFANMQDLETEVAVEGLRKSSSQRVLEKQLATTLDSSEALQRRAGLPEDQLFGNNRGSQRVRAQALTTVNSANEESIKNAQTIINYSNLTDDDLVRMAQGSMVNNIPATDDIRIAAIRNIAGGKNATALNALLTQVDYDAMHADFKQELGDALLSNSAKPPWVGGQLSASIKAGQEHGLGRDVVNRAMKSAVAGGKLSAEVLVTTDKAYLDDLVQNLNTFRDDLSDTQKARLQSEIHKAMTEPLYSGRVGDRKAYLDNITSQL